MNLLAIDTSPISARAASRRGARFASRVRGRRQAERILEWSAKCGEARIEMRNPRHRLRGPARLPASHRGGRDQDSRSRAASAWSRRTLLALAKNGGRSRSRRIIAASMRTWASVSCRVPQGWRRMGRVSDPAYNPRPCPSHPEAAGCGDGFAAHRERLGPARRKYSATVPRRPDRRAC